MKNIKNKLILTITTLLLASGLFAFATNTEVIKEIKEQPINATEVTLDINAKTQTTTPTLNTQPPANANEYASVSSLNIVNNPSAYLNKKVKFKATFDKFSALGLDYKPAFRDSQKYITFLIKRDDVTDHTIPLSEMKIFIKRTEAEKFIELDSGDIIEIYGKVFSDALTDAWVDTDKLIIICKKTTEEKTKK